MKIAVPAADDSGLEAEISEHFGRSPYFTVWDQEMGDVEVVPNSNPHHSPGASEEHGQGHEHHHGHGFAFQTLSSLGIDVLACRGLGMRAMQLFEANGVKVLCGAEGKVSDAIEAWKNGSLVEAGPQHACHHGHH